MIGFTIQISLNRAYGTSTRLHNIMALGATLFVATQAAGTDDLEDANQLIESAYRNLQSEIVKEVPEEFGGFLKKVDKLTNDTKLALLMKYKKCKDNEESLGALFESDFKLAFHAIRGIHPVNGGAYQPATELEEKISTTGFYTSPRAERGDGVYTDYHLGRTTMQFGRERARTAHSGKDTLNNSHSKQMYTFVIGAGFLHENFSWTNTDWKVQDDGSAEHNDGAQHWSLFHYRGLIPLYTCHIPADVFERHVCISHHYTFGCDCVKMKNLVQSIQEGSEDAGGMMGDATPEDLFKNDPDLLEALMGDLNEIDVTTLDSGRRRLGVSPPFRVLANEIATN